MAEGVSPIPLDGLTGPQLEDLGRRLGLGLSAEEMARARDHFARRGHPPTDIELQSIAQAWSEHCCYKSSKALLREFVVGIPAPQVLITGEDAGVVAFDRDHAYVVKMESHNHPSAIEPYGGASTGVGGILRDIACMGAQPIALVDPLFFAPLDLEAPPGVHHPRYILGGVVAGIRDYGNRMGIPTVAGQVTFHPGYLRNPLVNAGCVGIARRREIIHSRARRAGELLVLAGGRTGRDGIHGVTFASRDLAQMEEDRGAVQLGDPITQEPTLHALRECVQRGLLSGLKDLGGGGLSCVVGELALAGRLGARVELEKVPLKEEGMAPWEIWVSESQERFMLTVDPRKLEPVLEVFRAWDVEATVVGQIVPGRDLHITWHGEPIFDLDLEFLTGGPEYCRPWSPRRRENPPMALQEPRDYGRALRDLLASPDICSRETIVRVYDHEVRGATVIKPLPGPPGRTGHGDAAVLKPLDSTWRGLAVAVGGSPHLCEADPYRGARLAVDEVARNLASVGGTPHSLVDCLNLGNPERPEVLGDLREVCRGLGSMARELGLPYVGGNVSLYNESAGTAIPPTPSLLGVGIVPDIRRCVTSDLKQRANPLYLVGETRPRLGASAYARLQDRPGGEVDDPPGPLLKRTLGALLRAQRQGTVASCHDISEGGTACALAEMCIGGDLGATLHVPDTMRSDLWLFSESGSRWLVEAHRTRKSQFTRTMKEVPLTPVGTSGGRLLRIRRGTRTLASEKVEDLRGAWATALPQWTSGNGRKR